MLTHYTKVRILVIKHGALGDIIQGLDSFATIRAGNPKAHITLMTGPNFATLAESMPWFDDVIIDPRAGFFNFLATFSIRRHLRQNWSLVVDMQCSRRTNQYFSHFLPPGTRWIGRAPGCSDLLPDFIGVNNRERMLLTAELAGGVRQNADMDWLNTINADSQSDYLADNTKAYAVMVPGCSLAKPQKRWPAKHFAAVANDLAARGIIVYLVGTRVDRSAIDSVLADAPSAIDSCGRTNLTGLTRLMKGASYVIGNDTGPIFLSAKIGAPTLMIMGPDTDPTMSAPTGRICKWLRGAPISSITVKAALNALCSLSGS
ncbi:glycosyltransferase family 9 protein [Candidatus Puniceispirillum sp.]|nr:glycosyltransferase family 9 protein [Candidatus Puniceispirillum sp.]